MRKPVAIAATSIAVCALAGCGGGSTKATRNCFELWNGSSNVAQQAKVAHRFPAANVTRWTAQASEGSIVESWSASSGKGSDEGNVGGPGNHGCGYLFHTDNRFVSFSAEFKGDTVHWGVPPTVHGSWSRRQHAGAPDNASVDAEGLLSPRS